MLNRIIQTSLQQRALVVIALLAVVVFGVQRYRGMPVDAFPDISPIMVPVFAEAHGMAPEEIERLITYPIESAMNGLPGVTQIKSTSAFGMAVIYVYFEDEVDIYFARQLVAERLSAAVAELPELHEQPTLGPISTGLGQIFIYYLTLDDGADTEGKSPDLYLRELNDWVVKYQLRTVRGVTDVLSMGGNVLQYQIKVDPAAMRSYGLSLQDLVEAVHANNRNAGGQFLVLGSEEHLVRGIGLLRGLDQIRGIPLRTVDGAPIRIGDVAEVAYGPEVRRGVVTRNGEQEVISGIVLKLYGENTSEVIERLYEKVDEVRAGLPEGVNLVPYYEQAELVAHATDTVKKALLIGGLLVVLIIAVFLGDPRSSLIVALSLPLCALLAIIGMRHWDISANLMSLGGIAIAIGMLGDGAIVMVENIHRQLTDPGREAEGRRAIVSSAAREVARPIAFSIAIIVMVFLPIFSFEGVEGKMFRPMASTICLALLGSLATAIILAPVLSSLWLTRKQPRELGALVRLKQLYRPLLARALRHPRRVVAVAVVAFAISLGLVPFLGTEFVPTLEEGSIFIGVTMTPSTSLEKATETVTRLERRIVTYAPVDETVARIGRPEAGSHPHPVNYAEIHLELKPRDEWGEYRSKEELVGALTEDLSTYPGVSLNFTQPIQNAFDELLSGAKTELAIKLYGEELDVLRELAAGISSAIGDVPGLVDLAVEQSFGQPQVRVIADRQACSRYGVSTDDVLELVELAVGGEVIDSIFLNTRRFGIHVRYQEPERTTPEDIRRLLLHTGDGSLIPLSMVAEVEQVIGPIQINREKNQRRWVVQGNVRGRDLGGVVADIQRRIQEQVSLPPGYFVEYGGQFENQQRAMARLSIIVPITIGAVFCLLWLSIGIPRQAFVIILNIPLALIGGVAGLFLSGEYLSVPASVGFIALFGIAVQNGLVLVAVFNQLRQEGMPLKEAVQEGALLRLRPVLMTACTTMFGLLPLLLSSGIGSEVQRPLAIVVVSGLASSTLLTTLVIPTVYAWIERGRDTAEDAQGVLVHDDA